MWLLHFLPDSLLAFIVDAVLIAGVLATVLTCFLLKHVIRLVPTLAPHVKIAQIASILLLLAGVYFKGGYSAEMAWREEAEAQAANQKLDNRGKEKVKIIREKGVIIKQYVDREVTKYDATCKIPQEVVRAHNAAAKNEELK
jgi:hypothetical protein